MLSTQVHRLRNILCVILGGIEIGNVPLAIEGCQRANEYLDACQLEARLREVVPGETEH